MRTLTKEQKKLIKEWVKEQSEVENISIMFKAEDLPDDLYWKLNDINDFETFNQEIEGYIYDILDQI